MATPKPKTASALAGFTSPETTHIMTALSAVQSGVALTVRDQTGCTDEGKEYAYSSLGATWEAVRTLQGENGLALVQRFRDGNLHTVLFHSSGEWIDYGDYPLGEVTNHNDLGGAISFARRYTLATVYGIAAEAEDDSAAGGQRLRDFRAEASSILNRPSCWAEPAHRDEWVQGAVAKLNAASSMDGLREAFTAEESDIKQSIESGHPEDKAAADRVRAAFDNRRDALSQPTRRRTVDSAASTK